MKCNLLNATLLQKSFTWSWNREIVWSRAPSHPWCLWYRSITMTPTLINTCQFPIEDHWAFLKMRIYIYILVSHSLGAVSSIRTHWLLIIEPIQRVVNIGNVSHFRSYIPSGSSYLQNSTHLHVITILILFLSWEATVDASKCKMGDATRVLSSSQ